jgi:hypothetical protein
MTGIVDRIKAALVDPAQVSVCESCGSVSVCEMSCRAGAARDRDVVRYLSVGLPR